MASRLERLVPEPIGTGSKADVVPGSRSYIGNRTAGTGHQATDQARRWLSIKELGAHLSVTERTIRRWIASDVPAIEVLRIGGIVRARLRDVRECPYMSSSQADDVVTESNHGNTHQ